MLSLISAPYHLGRRDVGMGAGPGRLLAAGAREALEAHGHQVNTTEVDPPAMNDHETGAHFAVQAALAERVQVAVAAEEFPFVLGGNCSSVLGVIAGLGLGDSGGVVWFDAHGDANTPETTESGFLDGMPVAVLTGRCWRRLAARIPGFTPLPDQNVVLAGVRSIDPDEQNLIANSAIALVSPNGLRGHEFTDTLTTLAENTDRIHLHIDLDVIDVSDGRANEFATGGGPTLDALEEAIRTIAAHSVINSVSLTSYNPSCDADGHAQIAAMRLLNTLGGIVPCTR